MGCGGPRPDPASAPFARPDPGIHRAALVMRAAHTTESTGRVPPPPGHEEACHRWVDREGTGASGYSAPHWLLRRSSNLFLFFVYVRIRIVFVFLHPSGHWALTALASRPGFAIVCHRKDHQSSLGFTFNLRRARRVVHAE